MRREPAGKMPALRTRNPELSTFYPPSPVLKSPKPQVAAVPLAVGRDWSGGAGYLYEEKMDGRFSTREAVHGRERFILAGEAMPGGEFYAFDVIQIDGQDVRQRPLRERLAELDRRWPPAELGTRNSKLETILRPARGNGGEFLEAVLARGGEGIVAKHLDQPFGVDWFKCKRSEIFFVIVTDCGGATQSAEVALADASSEFRVPSSAARMRVPLLGGKADRVRVGSVLKIEGFGLTPAGRIREPRVCKDTPTSWLVRF